MRLWHVSPSARPCCRVAPLGTDLSATSGARVGRQPGWQEPAAQHGLRCSLGPLRLPAATLAAWTLRAALPALLACDVCEMYLGFQKRGACLPQV